MQTPPVSITLLDDERTAIGEVIAQAIQDETTYFHEGWPAQDHGDNWLSFLEARHTHWTSIYSVSVKLDGLNRAMVANHVALIARKIDAAKQ